MSRRSIKVHAVAEYSEDYGHGYTTSARCLICGKGFPSRPGILGLRISVGAQELNMHEECILTSFAAERGECDPIFDQYREMLVQKYAAAE